MIDTGQDHDPKLSHLLRPMKHAALLLYISAFSSASSGSSLIASLKTYAWHIQGRLAFTRVAQSTCNPVTANFLTSPIAWWRSSGSHGDNDVMQILSQTGHATQKLSIHGCLLLNALECNMTTCKAEGTQSQKCSKHRCFPLQHGLLQVSDATQTSEHPWQHVSAHPFMQAATLKHVIPAWQIMTLMGTKGLYNSSSGKSQLQLHPMYCGYAALSLKIFQSIT